MLADEIREQFINFTPGYSKEQRAYLAMLSKDTLWSVWNERNPSQEEKAAWSKQVFNCLMNDFLPFAAEMGIEEDSGDQCNMKFFKESMADDMKDLNFLKFFGFISPQQARQMVRDSWLLGNSSQALFALKLDDEFSIGDLDAVVAEIVAANPKVVEDYKKGKTNAANSLIGPTVKKIKETGKSFDPNGVKAAIVNALES